MLDPERFAGIDGNALKTLLALSAEAEPLTRGSLFNQLSDSHLVSEDDIGSTIVYMGMSEIQTLCGLHRDTVNRKLEILETEHQVIERRQRMSQGSRRPNGQFAPSLIILHTDGLISTSGVPDPDGGDKHRAEISGTDSSPHDHDVDDVVPINLYLDKHHQQTYKHPDREQVDTVADEILGTFRNALRRGYTPTDRDRRHIHELLNDGYTAGQINAAIPAIVERAYHDGAEPRSFGYCVPPIRDHRPVPPSPGDTRAVDNADPYLRGDVSRNLDALRAFGVDTRIPDAQEVAALSHVTPALITAWGRELRQRDDVQNLPGLLLHVLARNDNSPQPSVSVRSEVNDITTQNSQSDQTSLPEEIILGLDHIGWDGSLAPISEQYAERPDFVTSWLAHTLSNLSKYENPGGYFRSRLRNSRNAPGINDPHRTLNREVQRLEFMRNALNRRTDENRSPESEPEAEGGQKTTPEPTPLTPEAKLWEQVKEDLRLTMAESTFRKWVEPMTCVGTNSDGELVLLAFNGYQVEWVHNRLETLINRTIKRNLEGEDSMGFRLMVQEEIDEKGLASNSDGPSPESQ